MTSSTTVPNPITNNNTDNRNTRDSSKRRKRKKIQSQSQSHHNNQNSTNDNQQKQQITPWRSEIQRQIYSSKLLQAVRHVRQTENPQNKPPRAGRAVREAADRILATTAKGRTRWSRAILTNKLKLKFMKNNRRQRGLMAKTSVTGDNRLKKRRVSILRLKTTKNLPAVQRKSRVLGGLVPGCRKQPFPVVLEEVIDYIPALEMQVKAMAELVQLLSGGGAGSSSGSGDVGGQLGFSRLPPTL